jgi:hypothetical protein
MRVTWTFLPTATIDLAHEKASDVPAGIERKRRLLTAADGGPAGGPAPAVDTPYSEDDYRTTTRTLDGARGAGTTPPTV